LHPSLTADPRVVALEGTDARTLDATLIPDPITAITADVSFISVRKALPAALALASPGCWLVVLVKPQFEAGREHVGKGGIVRDEQARAACVKATADFLTANGWRPLPAIVSPITGGSGNTEYLLGATRHD
jgi:23S rRNA (cytidine1920-2'-O)/16S rRNA (cytidine1409-2'-O)-methyltransferase